MGAIHSTKIPNGSTGERGPPQKVDPFFRNFFGWTEPIHWVLDRNFRKVWLNGSRPVALFLSCFRTVLSVPFLSKMPFPFIIIHYLNTNKCIFSLKSHFFFARFSIYCRRGNRAKKRGCLGGRFIIPHDVGKTSQILRNPLKFAFLTIFGCK